MSGTRSRTLLLLALAAALLATPAALAGEVGTRDSPTGFLLTIVDYIVHLVL